MTFLFVGYCFFIPGQEPAIGVFKRLLRIGLELARRGHDVHVHVTGRERYSDPLVEEAMRTLSFVDLPLRVGRTQEAADENLRVYRDAIGRLAPDAVLIGEVPLCGNMLEAILAAGQCAVPVVLVDNAYSPLASKYFILHHGPAADGVLLVGPSSHQYRPAPSHVGHAAPFIPSPAELRAEPGGAATGDRRVAILGYDPAVQRLGLELMAALGPGAGRATVVSPDPGATGDLVSSAGLDPETVEIISPPAEHDLFDLLASSSLAVVKGGFMQVTECLALGTPVVTFQYRGSFPVGWLPPSSQPFILSSRETRPSPAVVAGARRLLAMGREALADAIAAVHDGALGGVSTAADYLEKIGSAGPRQTIADCERVGLPVAAVHAALDGWSAGRSVEVTALRCTRTRHYPTFDLYAAVARARIGGVDEAPALVAWVFRTEADALEAVSGFEDGRLARAHLSGPVLIEPWLSEAVLPPREWDMAAV